LVCRALLVGTNTKYKPTRNTYYFYDKSYYGPKMGNGNFHIKQNMLDVSSRGGGGTYDVTDSELIGGTTAFVKSLETWAIRSPYQGSCANKGPSVVLVETEAGKKFSLYSPHSLANFNFDRVGNLNRNGAGYTYSENAMVYNLGDHSVAYSTKKPSYATHNHWSNGPTFGYSRDVYIGADLKRGTCKLRYAYAGYAASTSRTCGGASFQIRKMEIWHLAPPATPAPSETNGTSGVFAAKGDGAIQVSTIASSAELAAVSFAAGLDTTPGMWARCYVYGGEVGYDKTPSDFHSHCDGKGPTVTLARLAKYGRRFAAYAPASWNSVSNYIPGIEAMLYSLDTEQHEFAVRPGSVLDLLFSIKMITLSGIVHSCHSVKCP